jgi:hypothetical protein
MKTQILVEIEHSEPLPELTDVIASRAYQYVHAQGKRCGDVVAKLVLPCFVPMGESTDATN